MGILMGIVSFAIGFLVNLIDSAVEVILSGIGFDMSTFIAVFPFAEATMDTFIACGLAILSIGLIWQALKGLTAPFGVEYENPVHVFGKVIFTWFAVVNLAAILDIFTKLFQIVLDDLNSTTSGNSNFDMEGFTGNMVTGIISDATGLGGLTAIVYIICVIILGWKFIKLLIEMIERYIVYCFICFIGPIFVATAAFKSTQNIASTWARAFFGQSLLILLNTWSAKMFLSYCATFSSNIMGVAGVPTIIMLFFGFAFLNFASRIDSFLRILGLNTAHTGSSMAQSALGGITRMLMLTKGLQSMGGTLGNMAAAGKAAGGFGTVAGMKAAVSSFAGSGHNNSGGYSAPSDVGASTIGGEGTNRRADGSKMNSSEPGRRASSETTPQSGDILKQESTPASQMMSGQKEIMDALSHKTTPTSENGIGGTNGLKGSAAKMDYADGGVMSSAGRQGELANKNYGDSKPMGEIKQDALTANAVRAAATSAERIQGPDGQTTPIASYQGPEAAAAMNGVTAFGNEHLNGFSYAEDADGNSFISGQKFDDGSSVTFDSVEGGIASGVYTDAEGNNVAFDLVHDNAVESQKAMATGEMPSVESGGHAGATGFDGNASTVPGMAGHKESHEAGYTAGHAATEAGVAGNVPDTGSVPSAGTSSAQGGTGTGTGTGTGESAGEFDTSKSVGRIGDGSGETGFYVVPKQASGADATTTPFGHTQTYAQMGATTNTANPIQAQQNADVLSKYVGISTPVGKSVTPLSGSRVEEMQRNAKASVPRTKQQSKMPKPN